MFAFIKSIFNDDTQGAASGPCAAQVFSFIALIAAICWISFVVIKNHVFPDAVTLSGAAAWSTSHYLVHRASSTIKPPSA